MIARVIRIVLTLAVLAGTFSGFSGPPARAAQFSAGDTVLTTDYVRLRSNPGTDGTVRDVLLRGDALQVLDGPASDDGYVWYKVQATRLGLLGWVAEDFIVLTGDGDDGSDFDGAPGVRVVDGPVNVRDEAGLDGTIDATLSTGFEVPTYAGNGQVVSEDGYDWIWILYGNGIQGWVATDFLTPLDYSPNLGSDDGWSTAEGITVADGPVNRRATPGTDGLILDTLPTGFTSPADGSTLTTADGYTWVEVYRLNSNTKWGWVAIDFLRPLAEAPCIDGPCYPDELSPFFGAETAVVSNGPVNMRASASTSADILITLADGDYLFGVDLVYSDSGDPVEVDGYFWVSATAGGFNGYVAIDFLEAVD